MAAASQKRAPTTPAYSSALATVCVAPLATHKHTHTHTTSGKFGGDPEFYGEDTLTKILVHDYVTLQASQCAPGESVTTPTACFEAVAAMDFASGTKVVNESVSDPSVAGGCSLHSESGVVYAVFNSESESGCSTDSRMSGSTTSAAGVTLSLSLDTKAGNMSFTRSAPGKWCSDNHQHVLAKFPAASNSNGDAQVALDKCEQFCAQSAACTVCSVDCSLSMTATSGQCQWTALPECGEIETYDGPNGLITGDI